MFRDVLKQLDELGERWLLRVASEPVAEEIEQKLPLSSWALPLNDRGDRAADICLPLPGEEELNLAG